MYVFASRGRSRLLVAAAAIAAGALALAGAGPTTGASAADTSQTGTATYVVVYKQGASTSGAAKSVAAAGGQVVANYSQIGVVIARSSSANFANAIRAVKGVEGASATTKFATRLDDDTADTSTTLDATSVWGDSLSGAQWDMRQINVPQAQAISKGSRDVLIADIDTGLDFTHPDLAPNYDAAASTDCTSGVAQPLAVGNDINGHGTHTAGTIAAAANGTGIVGVAPNVKIAGVRAGNGDGYFFPEAVICSFLWVAEKHAVVTNNSYFADPWQFNCKNDPEQRAIWNAEQRALKFAQSQGVLFVAAEGNAAEDLSHPTVDATSPDFPPDAATTREITNACAVMPVEVPGVVGVTATGAQGKKSYYSSFGISTADVAAPGGDRILQVVQPGGGRVLSTFSSVGTICAGALTVIENGAKYCYLQGTSMASPHAVGVAALIASVTGKRGGALSAALQDAVNEKPCPATTAEYPAGFESGVPQACEGTLTQNSWYGAGEVDALKAVS
jgi:subtilisin family serine protease